MVLAFIVGGLALVRFYSRKQATFLFIGTGFMGAGLLDFNHVLLTSQYFLVVEGVQAEDLFAWSWTAERLFLSLFLFVSLLAWRQEVREGEGESVHEGSVYAIALTLTLVNLFFFEWVPQTRTAHYPFLGVSRPAEFLPGIFFLLAFLGYMAKGTWKRDAFEYWLLISLLISTMVHFVYMSMSEERFDGMFDAAHMLKIASYSSMLAGLLVSVYQTFRREAQVLGALTDANAALAREITVRAQTEEALTEGRARLQDFLDNANDLIQSVAPDGKVLYVNSTWKRTLGYSDDQLERLNLMDIVHPAHRKGLRAEFDRVLAGEDARRFNVEFLAADGRIVILSGSTAAQWSRGRPVGTQGIFRDVTEQRLAERQLAASQANLTALVENTGDAIWSVDRDHRLITFNSAFSLGHGGALREGAVRGRPAARHLRRRRGVVRARVRAGAARGSARGAAHRRGRGAAALLRALRQPDSGRRGDQRLRPLREGRDPTRTRRGGAARGEGGGRGRQQGEERLPRQHEPRAAHAAQLGHRLHEHPAEEQGRSPLRQGPGLPAARAREREAPPRADQRGARPRQDRGRPHGAHDRADRPRPPRHRDGPAARGAGQGQGRQRRSPGGRARMGSSPSTPTRPSSSR